MTLTAEQQALIALRRLRARVEELEGRRAEPIAVIGIGCRFPGGAASADAYWTLLRDGVDAVSEVPPDRWSTAEYYDPNPDAPGKMHTKHGGFVAEIDAFDPQFFGVAPREAVKMDPQQRMLLEVSWQALEDAGTAPDRLSGTRTGVFFGLSGNDYVELLRQSHPEDLDAYNLTGNAANFAAGRVSYLLGLQGPSLTVDTACSSSLVAVHLACQSLRNGESRLALAGGANAILVPEHSVLLSKARMLAPDGRCKSFDASADGYVRGEGCGVVVLKRLSDALVDRDRIIAVLRGTAVNQDGRSSGLTVPNGPAQTALIAQALEAGGVDAKDVAYVEAHGSGTSLGDPIEIRALNDAIGSGRGVDRTLLVGSAKTNVGHLEAAAGIAGLIKGILAVHHGEIPAHLHVAQPNPHVPWSAIPIRIATGRHPWPAAYAQRVAGVSSFGASGTNAHAIVAECPRIAEAAVDRGAELLTLSAKSEAALRQLAGSWAQRLAAKPTPSLRDAAFTAAAGRAHFNRRLALVANTPEAAQETLAAFAGGALPAPARAGEAAVRPPLAFLYTGQGAQYAGMGRELYDAHPVFRAAFDRCVEACGPIDGRSLRDLVFATEGSRIDETAVTQPALFAIEYALTELLRSWGIEPAVVLGHSVGGYAAACAAGIVAVEDAARLVAVRGRLMQALPAGGAMAAVFADERTVRAAMEPAAPTLAIAALNADDNIVISGDAAGLERTLDRLAASGIKAQRLNVSHAFHSPLMAPVCDEFRRAAASVPVADPRIACISDHSGRVLEARDVTADYWTAHVMEPVRFAAALDAVYARGCRVFVEIGPRPTLSSLGRRRLPEDTVWTPTLRENRSAWTQMLECVRDLYVAGYDAAWPELFGGTAARKIAAPTYPFKRERFWVARSPRARAEHAVDPWRDWLYEIEWTRVETPDQTSSRPGVSLVFSDGAQLGTAVVSALRDRGGSCVVIEDGSAEVIRRAIDEMLVSAIPAERVVYARGGSLVVDSSSALETVESAARDACEPLLHLVQALARAAETRTVPPLAIISCGAYAAGGRVSPIQSMLPAFARVVAQEHPELRVRTIDVAGFDGTILRLASGAADLASETELAIREHGVWTPRLRTSRPRGAAPIVVRDSGAYLVTGASSGLGLLLAGHLGARGARHLVLIARRTSTPDFTAAVTALRDRGVRVDVAAGSVGDPAFVRSIAAGLSAESIDIRGVAHAAGALDDGLVAQQTWEGFSATMEAKVRGAWNLHAATSKSPLDFFLLFSSSAALLGATGQLNYAACNAFMDGLAEFRASRSLPAVSIAWGPWSGVGAAARAGTVERGAARGLRAIDPDSGLRIFDAVGAGPVPHIAAIHAEWERMFAGAALVPSLVRDLAGSAAASTASPQTARAEAWLRDAVTAAPALRKWPVLLEAVSREAGTVLGVEGGQFDVRQGLRDLGLDSLMALELRNRLQRAVGHPLRSTLAFDFPTIESIAQHLQGDVLKASAEAEAETPTTPGAADLLLEIENLTDEEVEKLFASKASGAGASL